MSPRVDLLGLPVCEYPGLTQNKMADDCKVLAKVFCISSSQFSSLYGRDGLDVDGIVFSKAKIFGGKDRSTLCLSNTTNFNPKHCKTCLLLNVLCKPITEDEVSYLCVTSSNDDNSEDGDNPDRPPFLFLRAKVLRKHGIKSGQEVWLEKVSPLALSKVVLKTKSGQKSDDDLVLKLSEHFKDNRKVVRESDILTVQRKLGFKDKNQDGSSVCLLSFDVLKCEPVSQGIIDTQTNLILLKANEKCTETEAAKETTEIDECPSSTNINMLSLLIADFTSPLHGIWCDRPQKRCKTAKLKIQVSDWQVLHQSLLDSGYHEHKHDMRSSHCLYVSLATLMDIGVQNGSWVKIWVHENHKMAEIPGQNDNQLTHSSSQPTDRQIPDALSNEMKVAYHYAQLYAVDCQGNISHSNAKSPQISVFQSSSSVNQIVYVSPLLYFNLVNNLSNPSQDAQEFLRLIPYSFEKKAIRESEDGANEPVQDSVPPFAKEAQISLVQTVFVRPGYVFDKILERHFSKPRLLTVGDIFCIHLNRYKDLMSSLPSELDCQSIENSMVYFKVMKLTCTEGEKASCLVDVDHTTVYQASGVQSFVPVVLHPTMDQKEKTSYWYLPTPPGLEVATEQLNSIIKPYLKQNVQMMPAVLVIGPKGVGKRTMVLSVGRQLGLLTMNINCYDLIGDSVAATEARISNVFMKAIACRPCILLFRHINVLAKDRDGLDEPRIASTLQQSINDLQKLSKWPVVVVATSSSSTMSAQVHSCFLHEVKVKTPSEDERKQILEALSSMCCVASDVSLEVMSKRTAGLVLADFVSLFTKATSVASKRISRHYGCLGNDLELSRLENSFKNDGQNAQDDRGCEMGGLWKNVLKCGPKIVLKDLQDALEEIQGEHSDAIGAPKIPSVSWQDIGGLLDVKAELLDTIQLPLQHPELFASGLRRSGVLLYGPPGTGKTLLAKAVATECSLNFLSVKGPELINMYVGQSEENVRHVFSRAQSASPCVIFFDELDSLAPNRGRSGDSGGVMDRVVSQLLAELDGLHKSCDVFIIGATNRPDLLDPALLRPGRFDKLLYLGISEDHESQLKILKALTSKFELSSDCDLASFSRHCPLNFTGADLYALCSDAMLHAIKRCLQEQQDSEETVSGAVQVNEEDFLEALKGITPSVPEHELQRYEKIRQQFAS